MVLADTLSRAYLKETGKDSSGDAGEVLCVRSVFEMEMESINAVDCSFISSSKIQDIRKATAEDQSTAGADDHHLQRMARKKRLPESSVSTVLSISRRISSRLWGHLSRK